MPAAGNRQAHAIDAPDRLVDATSIKAQRLNPRVGLGQDEDDLFGRPRRKLAVEQASHNPPSPGASRGNAEEATRARITATMASSARIDRTRRRAEPVSPAVTRGVSHRLIAA